MERKDILIVGAGLSGAVLAERYASEKGLKVLIIDKRDHIGGNCFDYKDENDILINKYGAHLFHTNDEQVWNYVRRFCRWERWDHRVLSSVDGKLVPMPVNINTVNALCSTAIKNSDEMDEWLKTVQLKYDVIKNSEEIAKSQIGELLYNKVIRDYSFKQWNKYPNELDASVLSRIPVKNNFDDRYFDDRYQALPSKGYTHFFKRLLDHPGIEVRLNCDFFQVKDSIRYDTLLFTGPIDHYYEQVGLEKLEYRSIDFVEERYKNINFYQTNSVINFPELQVPHTRIVEYKHFLHQQSPHTTIVKEFPKDQGEPYYTVPNSRNLSLYGEYEKLAQQENDVFFIGRLANYKYFNMDQAIKNALTFYDSCTEKE